MLNIKGAYVVIGPSAPRAILLSCTAYQHYTDLTALVGFDKATRATFGATADYALPCTAECMEFIALNFEGAEKAAVRQLCARIALGQPLGDGKDLTEGGQGARIDTPVVNPKSPSGAAVKLTKTERLAMSVQS